ncbi:hypothetical protein H257_12058 [Aphanomyces astaci]|uniref:Uncharacterized protein n=1 Tax=Aphanomyces astaci TaxID=112090 RepID=W4FZX6_APHAT|nr:hypothetical protein H257_12058 [Aphanomyces astaci]ETV73020.1 hypothetical protein H257_12058 [Aphanomyces astaci]|eukprot:XP_009837469.1 hypothetical protein H257_12058 [Aphanomyces astaci]
MVAQLDLGGMLPALRFRTLYELETFPGNSGRRRCINMWKRHNCHVVCGHVICGPCSTHRIHTNYWTTLRACDTYVADLHSNTPQLADVCKRAKTATPRINMRNVVVRGFDPQHHRCSLDSALSSRRTRYRTTELRRWQSEVLTRALVGTARRLPTHPHSAKLAWVSISSMARPREAAAKNGRKPLGACCSSKRRLLGERPRVLALRDVGLPTWHLTMNRVKLAARVDSCSTSCVGNATSHDDHAIRMPFALEGMAWPGPSATAACAVLSRADSPPSMCGGLTRIQVAVDVHRPLWPPQAAHNATGCGPHGAMNS